MKLLVIRHAPAEDAAAFASSGQDDALRPLTPAGKRKMKKAAAGLRRVVGRIECLASSPYRRALQTARILARKFDDLEVEQREELVPGRRPAALLRWLKGLDSAAVVAVVGHEPHLSRCVSWLLTGQERPVLSLGKGGACLLEFEAQVAEKKATLRWVMRRGQLKRQGA